MQLGSSLKTKKKKLIKSTGIHPPTPNKSKSVHKFNAISMSFKEKDKNDNILKDENP
jgi:hypothetical protein